MNFGGYELPDGWKYWEGFSSTVVSSEVGIVVTCPDKMQVVLTGALCGTDKATVGSLTVTDGTRTADLDVLDEQRWVVPSGNQGLPGGEGADLTVKIDVTAGGFVWAWGFLRPFISAERHTSVASIA